MKKKEIKERNKERKERKSERNKRRKEESEEKCSFEQYIYLYTEHAIND